MSADAEARAIITRLNLSPHPEGGWFKETWRAPAPDGEDDDARSPGTAILYLLEAGQRSHWHKVVDAAELWMWHTGNPIALGHAADDAGPVKWWRSAPMCWAVSSPST